MKNANYAANMETKIDTFAKKLRAGIKMVAKSVAEALCEIGADLKLEWPDMVKNFRHFVRNCVLLVNSCFNLVVKLSIIAIAAVMLYNFATANPDIATQINDGAVNAFNTVSESVIQAHNDIVEFFATFS